MGIMPANQAYLPAMLSPAYWYTCPKCDRNNFCYAQSHKMPELVRCPHCGEEFDTVPEPTE